MSEILICPQCQAQLRYTPPPQPKKSLCPKCRHELLIPAMKPMMEQSIVTPSAAPRPAFAAPPQQAAQAAQPYPEDSLDVPTALPAHAYDEPPRGREEDDYDRRPRRRAPDSRATRSRDADPRDAARDWDDDFDPPRRRRTGSRRGLVLGLSIGGGLLLIGGVVVLLVVLLGGGNPLVGRWKMADVPGGFPGFDVTMEFTRGGEVIVNAGPMSTRMRYKTIDANSIEITLPAGGFGGMPLGPGGGRQFYRIEGDTLILSDRPGGFGLRLRRA
ncbi:MAG: hypothetical protein U0793_18205 [Gemmataceae bacterium]